MEPINQKIAITGLGIVGPFGLTRESLWEAQTATGVSFQPCSRYINGLPSAEVPPINLRDILKIGQLSRMPLVSQYAVLAVHAALKEAMLLSARGTRTSSVGIIFGTSNGPGTATQQIYDDLLAGGPAGVKPRTFPESVFNAPASLVSIHFGLTGPIQVVPSGLCSGATVLYHAQMMLAQPGIKAVVALCSEELCDAIQEGLHAVKWHARLMPDGTLSRGAVMAEGAVALVLERTDRALERNIQQLAELGGVGLTNDAASLAHPARDGRGLALAINEALADAQVAAGDVDLVLLGSAGTNVDDELEGAAMRAVFGTDMPQTLTTKRSIGVAMGSTVLMDVAFGMTAINKNASAASSADKDAKVQVVLCNAIGLNGQFGAILVRGRQ